MVVALTKAREAGRRFWSYYLPWGAAGLTLGLFLSHLLLESRGHFREAGAATVSTTTPAEASSAEPSSAVGADKTIVTLTKPKLEAAGLATEPVRLTDLPSELGVTGRIEVNADRRVEVRSRAAGVVREVHVVLGQKVKKGDPLVTLDSPDVATARLNLRAKQRELVTARIEYDWKSQIAATVARLIPEMTKGVDPEVLEKEFADKPLGAFRGLLLQTYAEFDIASHEESKTNSLRSEKVIGEHPVIVAKHTRQGLQARLYSTIEQARFDAGQQERLADQALKLAESAVVDAAQRLRILGVDEDIQRLLDHADEAQNAAKDEDVTAYRIEAPFDGTIITKSAVPSQRADPIDLLFVLADLSSVWATANIPESDLAKIPTLEGGAVHFQSAAFPDRVFEAEILSVGALVDPATRTVPMIARAGNPDGLLRPGMFARILFDGPDSESALTIPSASVVEIEGKPAVFRPVAEADSEPAFELRPIEVGRELGDRVVVKSGLDSDELVVARGAFVLKSELILQNQGDDD